MKRVVLDTNVLVSTVLGGQLAPVLDHKVLLRDLGTGYSTSKFLGVKSGVE